MLFLMYGSQVWGTGFLQAGREFSSPLSTLHLHFLKGTLGVKQSTTNWAVLRECGHVPLQFFWFRSAVKLFNSMLNTNSDTLRRVVQADLNFQPRSSACWTAQLLSAFQGLRGRELYIQRAVQTGRAIHMQEFTADLKHRMRGVWRDTELVNPNTHNNKLAPYHSWFATPFSINERMPTIVPRYLHLDLSKHVMRNVPYNLVFNPHPPKNI